MNHGQTKALITGGSQGVGLAIARRLVAQGCQHIVLAGRDPAKGDKAVRALTGAGRIIHFESVDLSDADACTRLVETAIDKLGAVNGLVNSAGMTERGTLLATTAAQWDAMFAVNTRAPFLLMQRFVKHRRDSGGGGSIVNILSQNVHCGQSFLASYSASKGALATLTKNVANAYRFDRIRCNAILPGWMDTPGEDATQRIYHGATDGWLERAEQAQPMKQLAKPDQLAGLASYMLHPGSGVMTGALVDYDQNVPGSYPE